LLEQHLVGKLVDAMVDEWAGLWEKLTADRTEPRLAAWKAVQWERSLAVLTASSLAERTVDQKDFPQAPVLVARMAEKLDDRSVEQMDARSVGKLAVEKVVCLVE